MLDGLRRDQDGSPRNWAGNITFGAARFASPASVEELQELVAGESSLRALGSGHSFSRVADTTGTLVSTRRLALPVEVHDDEPVVVLRDQHVGVLRCRLPPNDLTRVPRRQVGQHQ